MWKWLVAGLALVVIGVGLWAFEPWRLFTSSEVDEPLPSVAVDGQNAAPDGSGTKGPSQPELVELDAGDFEDAEHDTSGTARVIELSDGSRYLRFEDLATSDGPDLHVWVTDQPSGGDWG
ncbi:MAG TPA: DM13 domain-containing protein, partial [Nocardioides sp.]|nr:DM13 domain-containing protein [Nocardioides sp.]